MSAQRHSWVRATSPGNVISVRDNESASGRLPASGLLIRMSARYQWKVRDKRRGPRDGMEEIRFVSRRFVGADECFSKYEQAEELEASVSIDGHVCLFVSSIFLMRAGDAHEGGAVRRDLNTIFHIKM
ncbi:hypothetical protein EVAR_11414_1 [Eumeta japonica]|uniref:Uncharacterized protein n=1 Tax=Eumeta variegata TaxID=151549 RepID=A0A4C1TN09_EUMVA|nr:hypothetical protein EVAR_11414_1 [Eumeta japonica]